MLSPIAPKYIAQVLKEATAWPKPFPEKETEQAFLQDYAARYANQRRTAIILGLVLWLAFCFWDVFHHLTRPDIYTTEVLTGVLLLRAAGALILGTAAIASQKAHFLDDHVATNWIAVSAGSAGVLLIGMVLITPDQINYEFYFIGILLVLLFIYGFFHIRAKPATHISLIILAAMIVAEWLFQPQKDYFIPALFYYVCFCFIGNSISVRLENSARESFSTIAGLEEQRQLAVIAQLRADLERTRAENERLNAIQERARAEEMMSATLAQREQLIQTMKTKSDERDRFVRAAYHDTMQPLAAISAFTFAAAQQIRTNNFSHCEHHLLAIDVAAKDIESMFRGIYDFFQIGAQPIHLRPITVNQIIEATCARQQPLAEKSR